MQLYIFYCLYILLFSHIPSLLFSPFYRYKAHFLLTPLNMPHSLCTYLIKAYTQYQAEFHVFHQCIMTLLGLIPQCEKYLHHYHLLCWWVLLRFFCPIKCLSPPFDPLYQPQCICSNSYTIISVITHISDPYSSTTCTTNM